MIRRMWFTLMALAVIFASSPAFAASDAGNQKMPTRWNYAYEWVNLNLFTWKTESKIKVYDKYATERAEEIKTIANQNDSDVLSNLVARYSNLIAKAGQIIQKDKDNQSVLVDIAKIDVTAQQKILSEARQAATVENDRKIIASAQEKAVNTIKQNITDFQNADSANQFTDQMVSTWRDPKNTIINDEKETRVYAAGTTENGTIDDGVIIDGGEAKISKDSGGNLKIEYAPGTGPSSVTSDNGKKLWKIQMSDGTVVESYTAGSNVVVGKSTGTASNIVVNTVSGGTSGTANVVVGNSGGSTGNVVVGGKSIVNTVDNNSSTGTGNTINNSTNTVNQSSGAGSSGGGQTVEGTAP